MTKEFDKHQEARLQFLADAKAVLHFPFFANTFSLAYHYANVLHRSSPLYLSNPSEAWQQTRVDLREHNWEEEIPLDLDPDKPNVFYATSRALTDFEFDPRSPDWHIVGIPFTRYKPLWLFTDYRAFLDTDGTQQRATEFTGRIARRIRNQSVNRIELFTDIPNQCKVLCNHLGNWGLTEEVMTMFQPADALRSISPSEATLRMYFYGAPATARMLEEPMSYIPFKIPAKANWEDQTNITQVCLALPKHLGSPTSSEMIVTFERVMREYHYEVFAAAREDYTALINVWWAYNRYAERKKSSSTFRSSEIFAKCLQDHHQPV